VRYALVVTGSYVIVLVFGIIIGSMGQIMFGKKGCCCDEAGDPGV